MTDAEYALRKCAYAVATLTEPLPAYSCAAELRRALERVGVVVPDEWDFTELSEVPSTPEQRKAARTLLIEAMGDLNKDRTIDAAKSIFRAWDVLGLPREVKP